MTVDLTDFEIKELQEALNRRFSVLRREISAELTEYDQAHYVELAGRVHDLGDEAVADLLVDIELASVDRHIQEVNDIELALLRIAEGSYGECCDCNGPVSIDRLRAYPTARRCIVCQEIHDRTFAHCGQPNL